MLVILWHVFIYVVFFSNSVQDGTDGEVIDPSVEGPQSSGIIKPHSDEAEDQSTISSDLIQPEARGEEILSPIVNQIGIHTQKLSFAFMRDMIRSCIVICK